MFSARQIAVYCCRVYHCVVCPYGKAKINSPSCRMTSQTVKQVACMCIMTTPCMSNTILHLGSSYQHLSRMCSARSWIMRACLCLHRARVSRKLLSFASSGSASIWQCGKLEGLTAMGMGQNSTTRDRRFWSMFPLTKGSMLGAYV